MKHQHGSIERRQFTDQCVEPFQSLRVRINVSRAQDELRSTLKSQQIAAITFLRTIPVQGAVVSDAVEKGRKLAAAIVKGAECLPGRQQHLLHKIVAVPWAGKDVSGFQKDP